MIRFVKFFDRLEDRMRGSLSHHPIPYSIIGGVFVVLFWRGVWETADMLMRTFSSLYWVFYPPVQVLIATFVLMLTGLMVSIFIGDRIILSGLRHEKKLEEQTEELVKEEEVSLVGVRNEIRALRRDLEAIMKKK